MLGGRGVSWARVVREGAMVGYSTVVVSAVQLQGLGASKSLPARANSVGGQLYVSHACNQQISPSKQSNSLLLALPYDQANTPSRTDRTHRSHATTYLRLRPARPEPTAPPPRPPARLDSPPITQPTSALVTRQLWLWAVTRPASSSGSSRRRWLQQHAPGIRWLHGGPHHQDGHGIRRAGYQCWTAVYGAERAVMPFQIG